MAASTVGVIIPGSRQVSCANVGPESEIARLSKSYAESAKREATRKCEELRTQARNEDDARRSAEIPKLTTAIEQLVELKLTGRCTAVNSMLRRAVRETPNGVSLVVSDLENTCTAQPLPATLQPSNHVFVVLVGSKQHPIEAGFDSIQSRMAQAMPWINVIEPFRLADIIEFFAHPESQFAARK